MALTDGKRKPRRIISFDALTNPFFHTSDSDNPPDHPTSPLGRGQKRDVGEGSGDNWTVTELNESPRVDQHAGFGSYRAPSAAEPSLRAKPHRSVPLKFMRSTTPDSGLTASSSRVRWDQLRYHVLRPATPPLSQHGGTTPSSVPSYPQPSKPSRLARLGFRHVVEHAREAVSDDARKFAQELLKICWSVRLAEPKKTRSEREAGSISSSIQGPSRSDTPIATGKASSIMEVRHRGNSKSVENLQAHQPGAVQQPSVQPLHHFILYHATPFQDGTLTAISLPSESLVLSTLLIPFFHPDNSSIMDGERWFAIETFEVITRTWPVLDETLGVERYLWCCNAAAAATLPPMRMRILGMLFGLMVPTDTNSPITSPECFRSLLQGLFSLFPSLCPLSTSPTDEQEVILLHDIINKVRSGSCGELDVDLTREDYKVVASAEEGPELIRDAILLEALSHCLQACTHETRIWLFRNVLERYWIDRPKEITPIWSAIHTRTLGTLSRAVLKLLRISLEQVRDSQRAHLAAVFVQRRFIPDVDALREDVPMQSRTNIVNIILELICMDKSKQVTEWGTTLISTWYEESSWWKACFETAIRDSVSNSDWSSILSRLSSLLKLLPDKPHQPFVAFVLPLLYDKLVDSPPAHPCDALTNLLDTVARTYPQIFYKPLFSCAASSKEFSVVNHLCIVMIVAKFLPDFWIRDAEMLSVALMSDVGTRKGTTSEGGARSWAQARLGQFVLMLELIGCIQAVRHEKEAANNSESALVVETIKFVMALDSRLGILIEAKERDCLIPPSHKLLFCILLREMRLLTRSLKPASWLPQIINWFIGLTNGAESSQDPEEEEETMINRIQGLYATALDGIRSAHQRRSTLVLSKSLEKSHSTDPSITNVAGLAALFVQKETLLASLAKGLAAKALKLLVTMSTLLDADDYHRLTPHIWDQLSTDGNASQASALCFLLMKSAEKAPAELLPTIEVDLRSSDEQTKLNAMHKIHILFNRRFQILSQPVVADRARRPFKVIRGPLPFASTDVGSSSYILEEDPEELKDKLPLELRKRLAEIGWGQDDGPIDELKEWIRMPMSLMASHELGGMSSGSHDLPSSPSVQNVSSSLGDKVDEMSLLRRNSSTGGPQQSIKRKAVFVPSLTSVFPRLASLVFDPNFTVSSVAKHILLDFMRNDPTLLARPVLDLFTGNNKDLQSAILTIRAFLHVQRVLPSPMTHHIFNHVAGFLKHSARHAGEDDALEDFACVIPSLARLMIQVSGMSMREIRRAKLETFFIPSGSLWFPSSAPSGPMFPRNPGPSTDPFGEIPSNLVSVTIIRISQNLLFLAMLKRNPQDVEVIRKNMSRVDLPSINPVKNRLLELGDFVPQRSHYCDDNPTLTSLSLMLSRSHLLLVGQVFRSMSRHLNDRTELSILVDGLNRILLMHGDDIGIVGHVMIALMVASTRFRRLFMSGRGYALFMPAVIKVYTESEFHPGIRLAIEYAANRFYALHQEAFIFQTVDIIGHLIALPQTDGGWQAKNVYNLLYALQQGISPSTQDAAGIHNANKAQEREALIAITAEDKPQAFLSSLRRGDAMGDPRIRIDLPEEYESSRFGSDNLVRLFLTVIAHDPLILRAEHFLRLLRFMTPHLYHASTSTRAVLEDGIDALAVVVLKSSLKPKGNESPAQPLNDGRSESLLDNTLHNKSQSASNILSMRIDYISLVSSFITSGGQLPRSTTSRIIDLIKVMLKEQPSETNKAVSTFLTDLGRSLLRMLQPNVKMIVYFLQDVSPVIRAHFPLVDFSGLLHVVAELAANPTYAHEPSFSHVVVAQICNPILETYETAPSVVYLLALPSRQNFARLIGQAVLLRGADVIMEIEKRTPSYNFLAGVVLPVVMSLKTEFGLQSEDVQAEPWNRNVVRRAWARLLSYAMDACKPHRRLERSRSQDKKGSKDPRRSKIPAITMAIQVLKVIVIRAEVELSSLPGVWQRLASFLVENLAEGTAHFALHSREAPSFSPTPSPRTSTQFSDMQPSFSEKFHLPSPPRSFSSPRIIDYAVWSILELVCVIRTPLFPQMRLFIFERLVDLDHHLHRQQDTQISLGSPDRRPASIYTKPRRQSRMPTSTSQTHLSPSPSSPNEQSFFSLEIGRQPGYNVSSPHDTPAGGPKIVHLGPVSPTPTLSAFGRARSGGRNWFEKSKETTPTGVHAKIKSLVLVRKTYRRIRRVQICMGYPALLPMPHNGHEMDAEVSTTRWTKQEALNAITKETRELFEEFEESDEGPDDGGVLVDTDQSFVFA